MKRWFERQMIAEMSKSGELDNLSDWVWEAIFDLFTHE